MIGEMSLLRFTIALPFELAQSERTEYLVDRTERFTDEFVRLVNRLKVGGGSYSPVRQRIDKTQAALDRLHKEFDSVAFREEGNWEDIRWWARHRVSVLLESVSHSRVVRWLVGEGTLSFKVWRFLRVQAKFVRMFPALAKMTGEERLAFLERREDAWVEARANYLDVLREGEEIGAFTPEEAQAERRRLYQESQEMYEGFRQEREHLWER